jgi:hypothetical protein
MINRRTCEYTVLGKSKHNHPPFYDQRRVTQWRGLVLATDNTKFGFGNPCLVVRHTNNWIGLSSRKPNMPPRKGNSLETSYIQVIIRDHAELLTPWRKVF